MVQYLTPTFFQCLTLYNFFKLKKTQFFGLVCQPLTEYDFRGLVFSVLTKNPFLIYLATPQFVFQMLGSIVQLESHKTVKFKIAEKALTRRKRQHTQVLFRMA